MAYSSGLAVCTFSIDKLMVFEQYNHQHKKTYEFEKLFFMNLPSVVHGTTIP